MGRIEPCVLGEDVFPGLRSPWEIPRFLGPLNGCGNPDALCSGPASATVAKLELSVLARRVEMRLSLKLEL